MTKEEIIKKAYGFRGANREFSQEMGPLVESILEHAGAEVEDSLESSDPEKALSARMGKELNVTKQDAPESAGTPGQVLQLDENGKPQWVDAAEGGTYDGTMSDSSTNAPQNKTVKKYADDNFARKDGYYQTLTAGAADNIVGDPIAVTSGYTEKPLAIGPNGEVNEVADGRIVMNEVRGRAMAWNQLVQNGDFSSGTQYWGTVDGTLSTDDNIMTVTRTTSGQPYNGVLYQTSSINFDDSHKYFISFTVKATGTDNARIYALSGAPIRTFVGITANTWSLCRDILSFNSEGIAIRMWVENPSDVGQKAQFKNIFAIDLTLEFGQGHEPATVEQAEAMLASRRRMKPYFPYNEGTLLGARLLGWSMPRTANLLNPTIKNARLVSYTNPGNTNNEYTIIGFDQLTGAAIQFTPDATGVAESVTIDAENHFVIPGTGTLEIVASGQDPIGGDMEKVCVYMTWDGSMDDKVVAYEKYATNPDSANVYYDDNGTMKQVFENGIMKAASASVFEKFYFDSISKKWGANLPVGSVDLGTLDWSLFVNNVFAAKISNYNNSKYGLICSRYFTDKIANGWSDLTNKGCIGRGSEQIVYVNDESYSDAATFKAAMDGVLLWYERQTPVTLTDLYYKVGNDYVPMEEVFPDGFVGFGCNWATETLEEQADDANGQPTSITPETVENFTTDLKEAIKTLIDAQGDNVDLTILRSNLVAMCDALKLAGVVADYSISENPTSGVFSFSFTPNA